MCLCSGVCVHMCIYTHPSYWAGVEHLQVVHKLSTSLTVAQHECNVYISRFLTLGTGFTQTTNPSKNTTLLL